MKWAKGDNLTSNCTVPVLFSVLFYRKTYKYGYYFVSWAHWKHIIKPLCVFICTRFLPENHSHPLVMLQLLFMWYTHRLYIHVYWKWKIVPYGVFFIRFQDEVLDDTFILLFREVFLLMENKKICVDIFCLYVFNSFCLYF